MLVWFCVPYLERCQDGATRFVRIAQALLEHASATLPGLEVATVDVSTNDMPHRFNASGVRVWGNANIPPEFVSLPMTGYHQWKYYMVPSLYFFPERDGSDGPRMPIRYEGDLTYHKIKAFLMKAVGSEPAAVAKMEAPEQKHQLPDKQKEHHGIEHEEL